MCGISGFFQLQGQDFSFAPEPVLEAMKQRILHRGPDDHGTFISRGAALGMRRLSIIDLQTGSQPQFNEDGSLVVIQNGEIYNFAELRAELEKRGHSFKTQSDTEILPHLYEEYGPDMVSKLNGMFAFAIYDRREHKLFLGRDRMGKKPLHYARVGDVLIFGSELKSLLEFPGLSRRFSYEAFANYLGFEFIAAPRTIFSAISKLRPAEYLLAGGGRVRREIYWQPNPLKRERPRAELISEIRSIFSDSVAKRMYADVPVGVFLSGGIDSTLVTAVAAGLNSRLSTFSIGFAEESFNELPWAETVSRAYGTDHHTMVVPAAEAAALLPGLISYLDEPLADASIIPTYLVSRFAKPEITVALAGDGGDELFLGYDTYKAYQVARFCRFLPRPLIRGLRRGADLLPAARKRHSFEFKLKKFLDGLRYPPEKANYVWWGAFNPDLRRRLFSPRLRQRLAAFPDFEPVSSYLPEMGHIADPLDRVNYLDLKLYLQDDLLVKVDRMSMAVSLEVRAPFLDYRLVELALSIPNNLRLRGLNTKYILKEAFRDLIPASIMTRPKIGFDLPLGPWLRHELRDFVCDLLSPEKLARDDLFDTSFVSGLLDRHLSGRQNLRQLLWPLIVFQFWKETYKPEF